MSLFQPKLIVKRDGCLFDDDGGDAVGVLADVVTPTTKEAFSQSYGLSSLSISAMAR